jgi:hypothetical protein
MFGLGGQVSNFFVSVPSSNHFEHGKWWYLGLEQGFCCSSVLQRTKGVIACLIDKGAGGKTRWIWSMIIRLVMRYWVFCLK